MMSGNEKFEVKRFLEYKIQNVERLAVTSGVFETTPFEAFVGPVETVWCLQYEREGKILKTKLKKKCVGLPVLRGKLKYQFMGQADSDTRTFEDTSLRSMTGVYRELLPVSISLPLKSPLIVDNTITIRLEFDLQLDKEDWVEHVHKGNNYTPFFSSSDFSDFTCVSSEGVEFPVHRIILAEQSSVFRAMFDSQMMEARTNRVIINDITAATLKEMLRFMYCRTVSHLQQHAFGLLLAAEKYEIDKLKLLSVMSLILHLSVENIFDTIVLAERCFANALTHVCIKFIKANYDVLRGSEQWEQIDQDLLLKIIDSYAQEMHKYQIVK